MIRVATFHVALVALLALTTGCAESTPPQDTKGSPQGAHPEIEFFNSVSGVVAYQGTNIPLRGESAQVTTHDAPNGKYFTVQDLLNAVEESERQSRGNSEWFDGVDVHHVFFEGLELADDGVWDIIWGS